MIVLITLGFLQARPNPRDLSRYEVVGPLFLRWIDDTSAEDARVRDFLWDHWKHERRGTVRVREQWIEGVSDATYFVEPDKRGTWVIVESMGGTERACARIERVEPDRLRVPVVSIPDDEPREPTRYLLHPRCWPDKPYAILW